MYACVFIYVCSNNIQITYCSFHLILGRYGPLISIASQRHAVKASPSLLAVLMKEPRWS